MRASLRVVALAVAIAVSLAGVMPPARADAGKPEWSAGDYWVYDVSGLNYLLSGTGTLRMDVVGIDTANVAGVNYPSYRVRLQLNASVGTFNGGEAWYRVSDLALVKETFNVTVVIIFPITVITTISYDPPLAMQWPITNGKTWSASATVITVTQVLPFGPGTNTGSVDTTFTVQAAATVIVPAGSFETTPVRAQANGYGVFYWSPQAGNYARRQEFGNNDAQISSRELTAYRYQGGGFLGLPLVVWFLIVVVLIFIAAAFVLRSRRKPQMAMPMYMPPQGPPR